MNSVFIDSSFFKALIDEDDDFYISALAIYQKLINEKALLITTNFILDETLTLIRSKAGLEKVLSFRETILDMRSVLKIVRVLASDESGAWKWFTENWSRLSFTDCTSFAVMKRLAIDRAATFDSHFSKAGFTILN
ncbi:MAG: PilT domain-containing protein [Candidatus Gottesmanbacteria bacterium GW2011_GWA2_43_14]|uniref:PilT domain-containing protein n=1 Tax=Candidatus Gottesmanbacteria bacterium GW2011_GWA2_43_14 TaxID=1618443 RepID=A0A0G1FT66_9BACT|nr:MAG: PilT domain-containing protein [Candidatus Gottesmanbacteria bacterium GW2011_GWA2_43_14]